MAKLVDNEPQYEGEKKVWNLFGSKLPSNWVVYNNRSVNGREYDICVIAIYDSVSIFQCGKTGLVTGRSRP